MKTVNAKGEPFDVDGTEKVVDMTVLVSDGWDSFYAGWKKEAYTMRIPSGRVLFKCARFSYGIDFPNNVQDTLQRRLKKSPNTFLSEVGFEVSDDSNGSVLPKHLFEEAFAALERRREKAKLDRRIESGDAAGSPPSRLVVPDVGAVLQLAEDWSFDLHCEHRNQSLFKALGLEYHDQWWYMRHDPPQEVPVYKVTMKAGTMMTIDRIYLRKGAGEYSSFTFLVRSKPVGVAVLDGKEHQLTGKFRMPGVSGAVRFWAKLADVNTMTAVFVMETMKVKETKE